MKLAISIFTFCFLIQAFAAKDSSLQSKKPEAPANDPSQISRAKYVTGGVLGSAIGFGIGHAVQERYVKIGWLFTATEVTGLLLLSHANCFRSRDTNSPDRAEREKSDCENVSEGIAGAGLIIGFHIWEIVDVWKNGHPAASTDVMVIPYKDRVSFSLNTSF